VVIPNRAKPLPFPKCLSSRPAQAFVVPNRVSDEKSAVLSG
jgi:hypothetical protein